MTSDLMVRPVLAREIRKLNEDQQEAATHSGDLVVLAGPGSGKTRTLVARVGYLLETGTSNGRGVAAITYTNHAAREIIERLSRLGISAGDRLTAGTLHSWCLSNILRPYSILVGRKHPDQLIVLDDKSKDWVNLLEESFERAGVMAIAKYEIASFTKARRRFAVGDVGEPRDPMVDAVQIFEKEMNDRGFIDFDSMVSISLSILKEHPRVAQLVAARYPNIVVDEYQDLGPVLHGLVTLLNDSAGVRVSAFGDPDQTVMGFTGADPRYLNELMTKFHPVTLKINYRSGRAIIAASHAILGESRDHRAAEDREDHGVIESIEVNGGLRLHSEVVVQKIEELTASGVPAHEIAVLYPRKGPLLTGLLHAFSARSVGYVHERDEVLPSGPVADFIRACAARTVSGHQPSIGSESSADVVFTIGELAATYRTLRRGSGLEDIPQRGVAKSIASLVRRDSADGLPEILGWFDGLVRGLELDEVADNSSRYLDVECVENFRDCCVNNALTLADISVGELRNGKVALTTYHSAKGREWQVVILPGLVDGIMPGRFWDRKRRLFPEPPPDRLKQDRLAFYVGLTRAKSAAVLIYGDHWETDWGGRNTLGVSRFARDVLAQLSLPPGARGTRGADFPTF
ncbi:ATP-dependent helicase [Streptomyces sp. NBC_01435]|uniref:ATP-dependent helicase n=1 Tax=Streptomyces sp. NBC_01435 TaxID=2903865 RepID=UPI002E31792E|nr:ATP-dependent helicase [Streptomyces sp. NBC_01435]